MRPDVLAKHGLQIVDGGFEMSETDTAPACKHEQFGSKVRVIRLEGLEEFRADIQLKCTQCDMPFRFLGISTDDEMQPGIPGVTADGLRCLLPIAARDEVELIESPIAPVELPKLIVPGDDVFLRIGEQARKVGYRHQG